MPVFETTQHPSYIHAAPRRPHVHMVYELSGRLTMSSNVRLDGCGAMCGRVSLKPRDFVALIVSKGSLFVYMLTGTNPLWTSLSSVNYSRMYNWRRINVGRTQPSCDRRSRGLRVEECRDDDARLWTEIAALRPHA